MDNKEILAAQTALSASIGTIISVSLSTASLPVAIYGIGVLGIIGLSALAFEASKNRN